MQIRKHPEEGLNVKHNGENKFINIIQLADDTTLFLKNEEAILKALKIVENLSSVSGLKLIIEKTEGMWLGNKLNRNDSFGEINMCESTRSIFRLQ